MNRYHFHIYKLNSKGNGFTCKGGNYVNNVFAPEKQIISFYSRPLSLQLFGLRKPNRKLWKLFPFEKMVANVPSVSIPLQYGW